MTMIYKTPKEKRKPSVHSAIQKTEKESESNYHRRLPANQYGKKNRMRKLPFLKH